MYTQETLTDWIKMHAALPDDGEPENNVMPFRLRPTKIHPFFVQPESMKEVPRPTTILEALTISVALAILGWIFSLFMPTISQAAILSSVDDGPYVKLATYVYTLGCLLLLIIVACFVCIIYLIRKRR